MRRTAAAHSMVALSCLLLAVILPQRRPNHPIPSQPVIVGPAGQIDPRLDRLIDVRSLLGLRADKALSRLAASDGLRLVLKPELQANYSWIVSDHINFGDGVFLPIKDVIDQFVKPSRGHGLWYTIEGDDLIIQQWDQYVNNTRTVVGVYDIQDIRPKMGEWGPDVENYPDCDITPADFPLPQVDNPGLSRRISGLIYVHVDADWSDNSSMNAEWDYKGIGGISSFPAMLVVNQTPRSQRQIRRFLDLIAGAR